MAEEADKGEVASGNASLDEALTALRIGGVEAALKVAEQHAEAAHCDAAILHYAGVWSADVGDFRKSIRHLTRMFQLSDAVAINWYHDSALIVRAYAYLKTEQYDLAIQDLLTVPDDTDLLVLQSAPQHSKNELLKLATQSLRQQSSRTHGRRS